MSAHQHLVHRQVVAAELIGSESDGFDLQRRLAVLCQEALGPLLAGVFDHHSPTSLHFTIDRLEVDVGCLPLAQLEQRFGESLKQAIEEALRPLLAGSPSADGNALRQATPEQNLEAAWIYFLRNGHLPWWFRLPEGQSLERLLLDAWRSESTNGASGSVRRGLLRETLADAVARARLVRQFSAAFLGTLLARFSLPAASAILEVLEALRHLPRDETSPFEQHLWETLLMRHALGSGPTDAPDIVRAALSDVADPSASRLKQLLRVRWPMAFIGDGAVMASDDAVAQRDGTAATSAGGLDAKPSGANGLAAPRDVTRPALAPGGTQPATPAAKDVREISEKNPLLDKVNGQTREAWPKSTGHPMPGSMSDHTANMETTDGEQHPARLPSPIDGVESVDQPMTGAGDATPESTRPVEEATTRIGASARRSSRFDRREPIGVGAGLFLPNAGVALLHPFLPRFFSALGVADEDRMLLPERALCLLHFLATGQCDAPEYELPLAKLLCGVALETPVAACVALKVDEREEAEALLGAVTRHWTALRDTPVDGLRSAFLMRPGMLSERADGDHLLRVEANSIDILLDQLPWGIGAIRLPWMERMLWVEWH